MTRTGDATYFQSVNRNKDSLVLDLRDPDDVARARAGRAAPTCVVENFRPGVMDELGLGYEQLRADQPAAWSTARSPASARGAGARAAGL